MGRPSAPHGSPGHHVLEPHAPHATAFPRTRMHICVRPTRCVAPPNSGRDAAKLSPGSPPRLPPSSGWFPAAPLGGECPAWVDGGSCTGTLHSVESSWSPHGAHNLLWSLQTTIKPSYGASKGVGSQSQALPAGVHKSQRFRRAGGVAACRELCTPSAHMHAAPNQPADVTTSQIKFLFQGLSLSSELGPKKAGLLTMLGTVNSPFSPACNFLRPQHPQCKIPDALS